jgi:hypothetical protein
MEAKYRVTPLHDKASDRGGITGKLAWAGACRGASYDSAPTRQLDHLVDSPDCLVNWNTGVL